MKTDNPLDISPLDIYYAMKDIKAPWETTGNLPTPIQTSPMSLHQEQPLGTIHEQRAHITYLIWEEGSRLTKVGVTKSQHSLERRLANLQQGNGRELSVAHTWYFSEEGKAYELEQQLLNSLQEHRTHAESEWLNLVPHEVILFYETGELPE